MNSVSVISLSTLLSKISFTQPLTAFIWTADEVYLELRHSRADERPHVDHGPLRPDGHAGADGQGAGEELDGEGLDVEDVPDEGAVQETDELGHTRTGKIASLNARSTAIRFFVYNLSRHPCLWTLPKQKDTKI